MVQVIQGWKNRRAGGLKRCSDPGWRGGMGAEQVESLAMGTEESLVAARASDQRNETTANTDQDVSKRTCSRSITAGSLAGMSARWRRRRSCATLHSANA